MCQCRRCRKRSVGCSCCCCKRDEPPSPSLQEYDPADQEILLGVADMSCDMRSKFISKALWTKFMQFLIVASYFFFVLKIDTFKTMPEEHLISSLCILGAVYIFIVVLIRFKKNPPHYGATLIMLLLSAISIAYAAGTAFVYKQYLLSFIPLSFLFVNMVYLLLIPLFRYKKMTIEMSTTTFYLIPLVVVVVENALLLILYGSTLSLQPDSMHTKQVSKHLMIAVICAPTLFCSTVMVWISLLQLRQVMSGRWFFVMYHPHFKDYLYTALFLV